MSDVSGKIGEYMLKGWVLTDELHSQRYHSADGADGAECKIPLMRSPRGITPVTHFCVSCHEDPKSSSTPQSDAASSSTSSTSHFQSVSRSSTPPTEVSAALSSPTFALPPETPESRRRREQSDRASTEIGNRLLKGWAMLAEECPNAHCYGIPLVRPPKPNGDKEPRKECVICAGVYITERDWAGRESLVPAPKHSKIIDEGVSVETIREKTISIPEKFISAVPVDSRTQVSRTTDLPPIVTQHPTTSTPLPNPRAQPPVGISPLSTCARSLESTLVSLSERLNALTDPSAGIINPTAISTVAEAITKTTQALSHVKELLLKEGLAN